MARNKEYQEKFNISCQIDQGLYEDILNFCRLNHLKKSDLMRQALIREIQGGRDFQILRQCEKLIDHKLEMQSKIISIPAQIINDSPKKIRKSSPK